MNQKQIRLLISIILVGSLLRVALVWFSHDLSFGTDAPKYINIAQNILFKDKYSLDAALTGQNIQSAAFYPPVYPLFLAGLYYLFGDNPLFVSYVHIFLYMIACIAIFKLASVLFNPKTGIWAVGFFSIEPVCVFYSVIPMPEILIAIFLPLSLYFLAKFLNQVKNIKYIYIVLSSLFLALAMLTKPVLIYFPLVIILFIIIKLKGAFKKTILTILVLIITIGLIISPWIVRNYKLYNRFCFAETIDFFSSTKNFITGHSGMALERMVTRPFFIKDQAVRYFFGTNSILLYRALFDTDGVFNMYNLYKWQLPKYVPLRIYPYRMPPSNLNVYIKLFKHSLKFGFFHFVLLAILLMTYIFALAGIYFALKDKKVYELTIIILVNIYFAVIIILALCGSRHRFPAIAFYSILAGHGLGKALSFRKK